MARLYQKIDSEAVPLDGGGGGSVAIDNITITENSDGEIQVATTLTGKINQLNNSAADMGKVLIANGNGTAEWDDILVPIDYETITKNGNGELQVSSVPYDNTESGLTADNVQDAIDEVSSDLTASDGLNFRFATDGEGNYGYLKADDSFVPFKSGGESVNAPRVSFLHFHNYSFPTMLLENNDIIYSLTRADSAGWEGFSFIFFNLELGANYKISFEYKDSASYSVSQTDKTSGFELTDTKPTSASSAYQLNATKVFPTPMLTSYVTEEFIFEATSNIKYLKIGTGTLAASKTFSIKNMKIEKIT